jgi:hypothetical protein
MELEFAAYGWQGAAWDDIYPDDLPADWRLDYYGNEFDSMVVPASDWRAASIDEAGRWLEDTPEGFRFYWELDDADGAVRLLELMSEERGGLPGRPAGWLFRDGLKLEHDLLNRLVTVLPGAAYGEAPVPMVQTEQLAAEGITLCWQDGYTLNCRGNGLRVMQITVPPDLRLLRQSIEEQAAAGAERMLLLLKPEAASAASMRDLHTFISLLNG